MNPDPTINVVSHLRDVAGRVPERPALVMPDDSTVTFAQLWQRVCRVAAGLRNAGLQPGDRLVVMIPMSIDLYTVLLAIIQVGAVAVFVDPWMSMRKIAQFAAFAEPAGFAGIGRSHLLRLWEPALRSLPLTITTGRRLGPLPARYRLAELLRTEPDPRVWTPESPEVPALITFTSGSSGAPKGANRTHGFLAAQYAALRAEYTYDPADVDMPMFPVFALRNLADGIPSVIPDVDFRRIHETKGERVLRQIARHGVRTCTASPPFVDQLAAASQSAGRDPGLRRILTGGAPIIQQMVDAHISGVVFTADPTAQDPFVVVVSSLYGLGEGLVGTDLAADHAHYDKRTQAVSVTPAEKGTQLVRDAHGGEGLVEQPVPESLRDAAALSAEQLDAVIQAALAIERARWRPQDIEFCFDAQQRLFILQTRDITTVADVGPAAGHRLVWDNSNIIESYSGVTSPMTFSFIRHAYTVVYHCFSEVITAKTCDSPGLASTVCCVN